MPTCDDCGSSPHEHDCPVRVTGLRQSMLDAVDQLLGELVHLDDYLQHADDFESRVAFFAELSDALEILKDAVASAGGYAIVSCPDRYGQFPVPGGGTFKIGGGRERKNFDNPRLVSLFAARLTEKLDLDGVVTKDGEVGTARPIIEAVAQAVAAAAGATTKSFNSWRSTPFKELGIKLADHCETEETPLIARIEGRR